MEIDSQTTTVSRSPSFEQGRSSSNGVDTPEQLKRISYLVSEINSPSERTESDDIEAKEELITQVLQSCKRGNIITLKACFTGVSSRYISL